MRLTSPAFEDGGDIPPLHTCQGSDSSPALTIAGAPPETVTLALIVEDPDAPDPAAPRMTWDHWVVWNLPGDITAIREGRLPPGAVSGRNSWGKTGYGGPCPPIGKHRYIFTLYALDKELSLPPITDKAGLLAAMDGHILAQATLTGLYQKR